MALNWTTTTAQSDLVRLYEFLKPVNPPAAARNGTMPVLQQCFGIARCGG